MSLIGLATAKSIFAEAGLADAELFEALRFTSVGQLQGFLYPARKISLSDDAYN